MMQVSSQQSKLFVQFLLIAFGIQLIVLLAYLHTTKKAPVFELFQNYTDSIIGNGRNFSDVKENSNSVKSRPKKKSIFKYVDASNNYMDVCVLPEYDFLDPSIAEFHDPSFNPRKNCNKTLIPWTQLVDRTWSVVEEHKDADCKARCILNDGDHSTIRGEWQPPGPVDCEILEVVCSKVNSTDHGYIHTQIIPTTPKYPQRFKEQPNVFIILIDSMNTGMAKRLMPKTLKYMNETLGAVDFPYVNKVGENSQPNGVPLWFGRLAEDVQNKKYGGIDISAELELGDLCGKLLDGRRHIFDDFEQYGYLTMDQDEWAASMINWPNCQGFKKTYTSHHMHPFQITKESTGEDVVKHHFKNNDQCEESHHFMFKYFQQFLDGYKDSNIPLFSFSWIIDLAHGDFNGVARFDQFFLDFLKKNEEIFDNSFLFFMGDHGSRISGYWGLEQTELYLFEKHNPYTSISVPRKYRNTGIVEKMKENSKQLQTHFDTRATLLDILWLQPQSNFADTSLLEFPGEKGHSYFRQQPDTPRTCGRLPIPNAYCICRIEKEDVQDEELREHLGNELIKHVNDELQKNNVLSKCEKMTLNETTSLFVLSKNNYEIAVRATAPSSAHFQSFLFEDKEKQIIEFSGLTRIDKYGENGKCVDNSYLEKLCHCNKK